MKSLSNILKGHGVVSVAELTEMLAGEAGTDSAIRSLVQSGRISKIHYAQAIAQQAGLEFLDLHDFPVDPLAVGKLTSTLCRRLNVLPVAIIGDRLLVAMSRPGDVFALDDVRAAARMGVTPVVVEHSDLLAAITRFHRLDGELSELTTEMNDDTPVAEDASIELIGSGDEAAPIVRFVNLLINQAIQDKASDIHLEPGEHGMRVRYRIDGVLHLMQTAPSSIQNGVVSRLKIMSDMDIAERRKPQDGRMSVTQGNRQVDLRVATLPTVWGEKVVLRILDTSVATMSMDDLDLLPRNLMEYAQAYRRPYGMILVTGPTGSGKSTTLYTTLNSIARPEINVITVEDPVEFRLPGINQMQVNRKAGLGFPEALRSILRADPDVILVGEIRDEETAKIAIEAALTGHLVLSTLHTNDAPSAMTRLIEMGVEPFLVGSALDCVVAQRLARRLCSRCAVPDERQSTDLQWLGVVSDENTFRGRIMRAVGCPACSQTGYNGRIGIHEVMVVTEEIDRLTVERASSAQIADVARKQGMITLREDGWSKVRLGLTSVEEILRVVA